MKLTETLQNQIAAFRAGTLCNEEDVINLQESLAEAIKAGGGTPVIHRHQDDVLASVESLLRHPTIAASASGRTGGTQASDDGAPDGSLTAQCRASLPKTRYPAGPAPQRPEVTGLSAECQAEMQKHRAKN